MMLVLKKFQWEPGNCKAARLLSIKGTLLERIIKAGNNRVQDKSGVMGDSAGFEGAATRHKPGALLEETSHCVHKTICSSECTQISEKLSQKGS